MDQRKLKTRQAIQAAFLRLRTEKTLEQISVTELSRLAKISKATFYLHYRDIFELSEKMQEAVIRQVLAQIDISPSVLDHWAAFTKNIMTAVGQDQSVLPVLFSGTQSAMFPVLLENQLREYILEQSPELREDTDLSIRLTYHIQGGYHTYMRQAHHADTERILDIIADIHNKTGIGTVLP